MRDTDASILVGGHSGIPFGQQEGDGFRLNTGVVGMPANDGSRSGWFMLLIPQHSGHKGKWHRLVYDWRAAQTAMGQTGLDSGYIQTLESVSGPVWMYYRITSLPSKATESNCRC